jgi:hypothetical protein
MFPANLGTSWVRLKIGNRAGDIVPISLFPLTGSRGSLLAEVMAHEAHHQVAYTRGILIPPDLIQKERQQWRF